MFFIKVAHFSMAGFLESPLSNETIHLYVIDVEVRPIIYKIISIVILVVCLPLNANAI